MKTKRTLIIGTFFLAVSALMTLDFLHANRRVTARGLARPSLTSTESVPTAVNLKTYKVRPSDTDGGSNDCPTLFCPGAGTAIGCAPCWIRVDAEGNPEVDNDNFTISTAPNHQHVLYVPEGLEDSGKLLVFLPGAPGNPDQDEPHDSYHRLYRAMAAQGYHVLGLSTFTGGVGADCDKEPSCFGRYMLEGLTGEDTARQSRLSEHPQDALLNRLVKVLEWARDNHPEDGWGRYLIDGEVNWVQVNLAGFSGGSSYASFMGTLYPVGRVALFAGPNDGEGNSEEKWVIADYIERIAGVTDTRYYGLVHELNWADRREDTFKPVLYEVTEAWRKFGMEQPLNPPPFRFDPDALLTWDFMGSHVLISTDKDTSAHAAHGSVVLGEYKDCDAPINCTEGATIGYEPAWRCILGTGDASVSTPPVADAGPDLRAQCRGNAGATVILDGSRSRDVDCDVLSYGWTGPFGRLAGRNPTVFLPLGTNTVTLVVSDGWSSSEDKMLVVVRDTKPPSLQVTLTPTVLSPADHSLIGIHATVSVADKCGEAPPTVVLTSITSNEPDAGAGIGDIAGDIQKADFGTLDQSFLLRAETFAKGRRGRTYTITYTATDASGNSKQTSVTVRVADPHHK